MKKSHNFWLAIIPLLLLSNFSCQKGFLDRNPLESISGETMWKTEGDVQMAVAGVYSRLQTGFYSYRKVWLDAYSDNAYDRHNYYNFVNTTQGIVNSSNINAYAFFQAPYEGIAASNYFLGNIDRVSLSEELKNRYKAEVSFLRAMFYFDLVQCFGGVPLYKSSPNEVDEAKITQSSRDEVLNFIHEDLDFAINHLVNEPYQGHAVKGSAQALKTRVLLYQRRFDEAAILANEILQAGIFSLSDDYEGLFLTTGQQDNPEIMFSTQYSSPTNYHGDYAGFDIELGWWGAVGPYRNLVDEYESVDGLPISESPLYDETKPYENRDPRLLATIETPINLFTNPDGSIFHHSDPVLTGFVQRKYIDLSRLPFDYTKANLTDQAVVHIRFADVLLMFAEAENEAHGPSDPIYEALDRIRGRAGVNMPGVDRNAYNTQQTLREFIRHERRVELALEGHRYFDLKRWGIMEEKLSVLTNPAGVPLKYGEINNVLPFPQAELDKNTQLKQNEGYQ